MLLEINPSIFDSSTLGVPVGRLSVLSNEVSADDIEVFLGSVDSQRYKLVTFNAEDNELSSALTHYVQRHNHYCSGKVKYVTHLNTSLLASLEYNCSSSCTVVEHTASVVTDDLVKLSIEAGMSSRFSLDPKLRYDQYEAVYKAWIQNSVKHEAADIVLVAKVENNIAGLVTVKAGSGDIHSSIGLLAVSPEHRRMGIGKSLVCAAFRWLINRGLPVCEVVTQANNVEARNLYESCGGLLAKSSVDFHFWIGKDGFNDPVTSTYIPQNKPHFTGDEISNLADLINSEAIATHGKYGSLCQENLEAELGAQKVLLVTSGTSALELCSLAIGTKPGDEIIMPTYTFVSTATAFVNHGGIPVFVDIRRDTQNIDETKIEAAITEKTKAIVVVHYAGVPCEMDTVMEIAQRHNLRVIEDNAHGIFSTYKGRKLGTIGDAAALSFHYTKNLSCGEGGAVVINSTDLIGKSMIAWEKGTNRFDFLSGKVDKYAWVDRGSSFILSELNAAVLAAQVRCLSLDNFIFHPTLQLRGLG